MGVPVRDVLREKGTPYAELGLDDPSLTDDQLLDAMMAHPDPDQPAHRRDAARACACAARPRPCSTSCRPQRGAFAKEDGERVVDEQGRRGCNEDRHDDRNLDARPANVAALRTLPDALGGAVHRRRASRSASSFPACFQAIGAAEVAKVNLPVAAVLIWLMIIPMLLKIDFGALRPGRASTGAASASRSFINWAVKPFSMAVLGWLFIGCAVPPTCPPTSSTAYIAGLILLAAAPCTAMVFVWSQPDPTASRTSR